MIYIEQFRTRFAYIVIALLWTNAVLLNLVGYVRTGSAGMITGAGVALAGFATLTWIVTGTHWLNRQITTVATIGQVMLLVYALEGHPYQVDMHMYFFAMLAVLSGWLDWRVFVTGTIAIAAHHGGLSLLYADAVFPGGNDGSRVLVHAVIVLVQSAALGWIVINLRTAFETSVSERVRADMALKATEAVELELATVSRAAAAERRGILLSVADEFEGTIAGIARKVLLAVETLRNAARQMTIGARQVADGAGAAASSSQRASSNIVTVRGATDELAASISQIERQVAEASRIVDSTTLSAKVVSTSVEILSAKADDIDNIVGLISTIASHTNLLALNASIEAARYGAAGSGFIVVAQEVKALATQTSRATENIQRQIEAIRSSSSDAIHAIKAMDGMIRSLNDVSTAVAVVVEQQNEATAGIARTIHLAAQDTLAVTGTIEVVDRAASEAGSTAGLVSDSADQLAVQANHLDTEVTQFLTRIRAA
jgi:methyl-accepting chemotaxis protein